MSQLEADMGSLKLETALKVGSAGREDESRFNPSSTSPKLEVLGANSN